MARFKQHTKQRLYKKINAIKNTLKVWNERDLTMYGRILITKAMVLSQFNYLIACLPMPNNEVLKEIDDLILQFVRANKSAQKISKNILQLEKNKLGLNLTLMKEQTMGLKIAWVKRWINSTDSGWKNIIKHAFPLKENDFWSCNLMERDVWIVLQKYEKIPYFWKEVIKIWAESNFYVPNQKIPLIPKLKS